MLKRIETSNSHLGYICKRPYSSLPNPVAPGPLLSRTYRCPPVSIPYPVSTGIRTCCGSVPGIQIETPKAFFFVLHELIRNSVIVPYRTLAVGTLMEALHAATVPSWSQSFWTASDAELALAMGEKKT